MKQKGYDFDPMLDDYQCEVCKKGFKVTKTEPRYLGGKEVCYDCWKYYQNNVKMLGESA